MSKRRITYHDFFIEVMIETSEYAEISDLELEVEIQINHRNYIDSQRFKK